ncbi:hypothetical protein [Granulicella sp. S190]|uniref:hypothetical protein n=1 Tax=Granulicella sp. S190 TaxID=1747226 RepID=UPI00131C0805|nr:hypothetical protein [Granulicella sp. S190]
MNINTEKDDGSKLGGFAMALLLRQQREGVEAHGRINIAIVEATVQETLTALESSF